MIRATFFRSNGMLSGFTVSGHAGGMDQGENIFCAAVSSAAYLTANTITDVLEIPAEATVEESEVSEENRLTLLIPREHLEESNTLLEGFFLHLNALAMQYANEIIIDTMEV